jgi:hypothetical protein
MSLSIDWLGIAEGVVNDLGGKMTLVGFNPRSLPVQSFPAQLVPTFVMCIDDDEDPKPLLDAMKLMQQKFTVTGPNDEILFFADVPAQAPGPVRRFKSVPPRLVIAIQAPFTAPAPGRYRISIGTSIVGEDETVLSGVKDFWVINPEEDAVETHPGFGLPS